jgi:hypothetical protein
VTARPILGTLSDIRKKVCIPIKGSAARWKDPDRGPSPSTLCEWIPVHPFQVRNLAPPIRSECTCKDLMRSYPWTPVMDVSQKTSDAMPKSPDEVCPSRREDCRTDESSRSLPTEPFGREDCSSSPLSSGTQIKGGSAARLREIRVPVDRSPFPGGRQCHGHSVGAVNSFHSG